MLFPTAMRLLDSLLIFRGGLLAGFKLGSRTTLPSKPYYLTPPNSFWQGTPWFLLMRLGDDAGGLACFDLFSPKLKATLMPYESPMFRFTHDVRLWARKSCLNLTKARCLRPSSQPRSAVPAVTGAPRWVVVETAAEETIGVVTAEEVMGTDAKTSIAEGSENGAKADHLTKGPMGPRTSPIRYASLPRTSRTRSAP